MFYLSWPDRGLAGTELQGTSWTAGSRGTRALQVDVQQVANLEKKVPLDWIAPDGMHVTEACEEYARPLILDELTPIYVNGTPRHVHL